MDAPPISAAVVAAVLPESADSLPRSRQNDSWHADPPSAPKLRLMCSYGGHIVPRPHDKTLRYIGGDTRIIVIDRHTSLSDLHALLSKNLFHNQPFSLKYQLPGEDLDSLISVSTDEDLENMAEEYERLSNAVGGQKRGRLRLFLFPKSPSEIQQVVLETSSGKSEDWFFDTLNGKPISSATASDRGFSESSSVNCLLGLDDDLVGKSAVAEKDIVPQIDGAKVGGTGIGNVNPNSATNPDVHSIPDSPMLGTTSSFGSTSSSPSAPILPPPAGVQAEDNSKAGALEIEEHFQQMSVGVEGILNLPPPQKQEEEIGDLTSAAAAAAVTAGTVISAFPVVAGCEYAIPAISDDEKSDHSGFHKVQQTQPQVQPQQQHQPIPQILQKQTSGFDLSSPDSVSSDGNAQNPLSKGSSYQEQLKQIQHGNTTPTIPIPSNQLDPTSGDPNITTVQMQQPPQESGYVLPSQFDPNHGHQHQSQHFIPAGNHYIPTGAMPILSYYPLYPPQQQHTSPQPYPVYIPPANQNPNSAYNLAVQKPNYTELAPTTPPSCSQPPPTGFNQATNVPSGSPQLVVQVLPSGQHQVQYVTFAPFPPPPSSAGNPVYDYIDPAHLQMYYRPPFAAQYQPATTTTPDHNAENIKQQP